MNVVLPPAVRHAAALLDAVREPTLVRGYLDVLADVAPPPTGLAQTLMLGEFVPGIYERYWRPVLGQVVKGPFGPSVAGELRMVREHLAPLPGDVVVDVACGPGNVTRSLAAAVGPRGLVIGVDTSAAMLRRAVADTDAPTVAYLRADAADLPLRAGSVDAVGCVFALHLFADPGRAVRRMVRALAPGGRIALSASCGRGLPPLRRTLAVVSRRAGGIHLFDRATLTGWLAALGMTDIHQRIYGFTQFVSARKPD